MRTENIGGRVIKLPTDERVFVVEGYFGLRAQQVCCVKDATDQEILDACNRENPQQTANGWHTVIRTKADIRREKVDKVALPGQCVECPNRVHMIALCM